MPNKMLNTQQSTGSNHHPFTGGMRALTVKISGGSSVLVPKDYSLLTPYILIEQEDWFEIVQSRVQDGGNGYLSFDDFEKQLEQLSKDAPDKKFLWKQLGDYAQTFL